MIIYDMTDDYMGGVRRVVDSTLARGKVDPSSLPVAPLILTSPSFTRYFAVVKFKNPFLILCTLHPPCQHMYPVCSVR